MLTGLGQLIHETVVGINVAAGLQEGGGFQRVSRKLLMRQRSARLAYRLYEHYRALGEGFPEAIAAWEAVCGSDDEFLDIKNQWLAR